MYGNIGSTMFGWCAARRVGIQKESETVVEKRIESAAIIAAALLRHHPNPSTEKIIDLLAQALEAIDAAVGLENRRSAKRQADLKVNTMVKR
jgi:hypothetical protein